MTLGLQDVVVVPRGQVGAAEMRSPSGILIQESQETCNPKVGLPHCGSVRRLAVHSNQMSVSATDLWSLRE